jgi:uncharacterized protein YccT (UPF0319 family)
MPTLVNNLRAIRGPVTAVPMVGASGVVVEADTQNNQVVVRADETVLYENDNPSMITSNTDIELSEEVRNFEYVAVEYCNSAGTADASKLRIMCMTSSGNFELAVPIYSIGAAMVNEGCSIVFYQDKPSKVTVISVGHRSQISISGSTVTAQTTAGARGISVYRVVGVNRKST